MHTQVPLLTTEEIKHQNRHFSTATPSSCWEKGSHRHGCIPRASYHICSQCFIKKRLQPLFHLIWGWSSALSQGKSPRELLGPAETGHLPGSSQACLKGMV